MNSFDSQFAAWMKNVRANAADGLSFRELLAIVLDGTKRAIQIAAGFALAGPEKKALVTAAVHRLYVEFLANVPIPYVPAFLQAWAHRQLAALIAPITDAAIEWLYVQLKPTL